jgi:hypothetical protein
MNADEFIPSFICGCPVHAGNPQFAVSNPVFRGGFLAKRGVMF